MNSLLNKILFSLLLVVGFADASELHVRPADNNIIQILPRSTATTFFNISNQSAKNREILVTTRFPKGWKTITKEIPFLIKGNGADVRLFSFFVPPATKAGLYEIKYMVQDKKRLSVSDETVIQVEVLPSHEISLNILNYPRYVVEQKEYKIAVEITNFSNITDQIHLSAITSEKSTIVFDKSQVFLQPGKSDTVAALFSTKLAKSTSMKNHIQFIAGSKTAKEKILQGIYLDVIPHKQVKSSPRHTLPTTQSIRRVFQQNGKTSSGIQGELYGKGTLDSKKTKHIEFRFRGPDIYSQSFLADHDEYFVNISTAHLQIHAGDGFYRLSSLTERNRYGRGASALFNINNMSVGSYYQQTRWLRPQEKQAGGFARYNVKNSFIGLNYLFKNRTTNAHIASIESIIKPNSKNTFEFELANGSADQQITNSYRARLNGQVHQFNYLFEFIHADANFPGYYRDTRYLTAGFAYRLSKKIRFDINIREEKQNFDIDSTQYAAPISHYKQLGMYYRLLENTGINLAFVQRARKDRLNTPKFHYNEETSRLGLSQTWGRFSLYASTEYGRTFNKLTDSKYTMNRLTYSSTLRFMKKNSVRAYVYYDNNQRYTGEKKKQITTGISTKLFFGKKSYLDLTYQNNYEPEDYFKDRNIFYIRLLTALPYDHKLSITGRHTLLRNSLRDKEIAFMLDYSVPLNVPVSKNQQANLIYGKVLDANTMQPVPDLYLRLDNQPLLTDKNGNFSFSNIKSGEHFLSLDESQLGFGKITLPRLPLKIAVTGGQKEYIEILISEAASINGRIFKTEKSAVLKNKPPAINDGLEMIYLELVSENGKERRFSDKQGKFYFEGLLPGSYSLLVYENNLPQYHYFENKSFELLLLPGQKKNFDIPVFRKHRQILFTNSQEEMLSPEPVDPDYLNKFVFAGRFAKELSIEPDVTWEYNSDFMLGISYYRIKKYRFAIDAFKSALDSQTKSQDALLMLGLCYWHRGEKQSALNYFKQVAKSELASFTKTVASELMGQSLQSNSTKSRAFKVHHNDGLAYLNQGDYKQALEAFSKGFYASENTVEKSSTFLYMGKCFYQLEKYKEALKVFHKASVWGSRNNSLTALYYSGLCHKKLDEPDASKEMFSKVAVLSSDEELADKANFELSEMDYH